MTTPVHAYWWKGPEPESNPTQNWGDRLNGMIPQWLGVQLPWRPPEQASLVMLGSVLEHLPPQWAGTVCGAGKLYENSVVDLSKARVLALRGRLTRDSVRGLDRRRKLVLGDPGLLLPHWVRQWPAKYDLGVIPHWSDRELAKRFPYAHIIKASDHPEEVVSQIVKCRRIISSSLHGLVIADAYGIPRQAELFPQAHAEGGDFKYRDYMSIYFEQDEEIDCHFGEMWRAPHHIVERVRVDLTVALATATGAPPPPRAVSAPADHRHLSHGQPQISLLVPFRHDRHDAEHRERAWRWLTRFWKAQLESVEIVVGHDPWWPYSKATAVNNAAERARGRIFVVLDADVYMDPAAIQRCADSIEEAVQAGRRQWFMPYRRLYRLDKEATHAVLKGKPSAPYSMPSPPPKSWQETGVADNSFSYGYLYGALIQMMPREAFFMAGGMDPRFRGWGSEDAALLRALDTIYGPHEVADNDVLHLFHLRPGQDWKTRRWIGQTAQANSRLAQRYSVATGEHDFMTGLTREHHQPTPLVW